MIFLSSVVAENQVTVSNNQVGGADDLYVTLRSVLRDVRSTLGSAAWTRVLHEMGPNKASVLRHRYKLY